MPVNPNGESEFDGPRDKINRYKKPHVVEAHEALSLLHNGDSPKGVVREDHFQGLAPLPAGLRKPRFAQPKWKGSYVPEPER